MAFKKGFIFEALVVASAMTYQPHLAVQAADGSHLAKVLGHGEGGRK